jgi:hypothetical protein
MSTIGDAFRAVFWGFFGVRKHGEYQKDMQRLKPQHVIAAGLLGAVVFVLALLAIVKLVTR